MTVHLSWSTAVTCAEHAVIGANELRPDESIEHIETVAMYLVDTVAGWTAPPQM